MRLRQLVQVCLAAAAIMGTASLASAQDTAENGKLKVTVEYKGTGTVSQDNRLVIWVFDTPNIGTDSMPLATGVVKENKGSYKFVGLPKQVYLAAAYDTLGGYDGTSGPPPTGTPVTIFGSTGMGVPGTAVDTGGDDATVTITFDDTVKIP